MSRSLKFRVWSKNENKYLSQDDLVNFWIRPNDFTTCFMEWRSGFDGETVFETKESDFVYQQYAGLKDKNDKEIYEGDIVKTVPDYMSSIINISKYSAGEVRWWNEGFAVCQEVVGATRISDYAHCECCPSSLEVLGNIFETPELLKSVV